MLCDDQLLIIGVVTTPYCLPVPVNGDWQELSNIETLPPHNPLTGDRQLCTAAHVNDAVQATAAAFPAWYETPPVERARVLFHFEMLLEGNFEHIARCNVPISPPMCLHRSDADFLLNVLGRPFSGV